jgi:hypothetical protein
LDQEYKEAEKRYIEVHAKLEMHYRISNILKLIALIAAILFLISKASDSVTDYLLGNETTEEKVEDLKVKFDTMLVQHVITLNKIEMTKDSLRKEIDLLRESLNCEILNKAIVNNDSMEGPKTLGRRKEYH